MDAAAFIAAISAALPGAGLEDGQGVDQPTLVVPRDRLVEVCEALRDQPALRFDVLADMTAVDWWPREPRYTVVYHLLSTVNRLRLRLEVALDGADAHVPTVRRTWASAGWLEREVWDLFGIVFDGHGDLRRLLMPEDWEGHPLRKDYPVQISMKPKVYAPLQVTEEEFHSQIEKDRTVRGGTGLERGRERS
ncbi:MAG: NADH-quinone oxidoreductase subunit C [Acidobacteria bacterium]|nr:NADH-quinone oxidoreductase subunit C [Acidobacteriota bacterium]